MVIRIKNETKKINTKHEGLTIMKMKKVGDPYDTPIE